MVLEVPLLLRLLPLILLDLGLGPPPLCRFLKEDEIRRRELLGKRESN